MSLAIFDLDNTLLHGDSDYLWGRFLAAEGIVDGDFYERENQRFYDQYNAGELDIREFLAFSLRPLADNSPETLARLQQDFVRQQILPIVMPAARQLVDSHRQRGDTLMIITATNRFVTAPIAELIGIPHLLATEPEQHKGRYTGEVSGIPCFQQGKVQRLQQWLTENCQDLQDSWFYSDSHNDLPLLEQVDYPVAVDPDDSLKATATARGWPIISLRGDTISGDPIAPDTTSDNQSQP